MKRLNKQPRELRPMDPGIYKWMSECPVEEQMIYVKRYANMQLEEALDVSQSNKIQIELKIYKLKQDGESFDNELKLMKVVDTNIDAINKAIKENDNYFAEYYKGEDVFE